MAHILIVEDEARIADFVDRGLRAAGHVTSQASDGHTGLHLALGGDVDLVVLDLGLPDRDGLDVLRELRERQRRARHRPHGARRGARPGRRAHRRRHRLRRQALPLRRLEARVALRLSEARRAAPSGGGADETVLRVGDVALDLLQRTLGVGGRDHDLTEREFHLLEALMRHPGQVLSREQLLTRCGASTSPRAPTSSTSTSSSCARRSAGTASRRCGVRGTG